MSCRMHYWIGRYTIPKHNTVGFKLLAAQGTQSVGHSCGGDSFGAYNIEPYIWISLRIWNYLSGACNVIGNCKLVGVAYLRASMFGDFGLLSNIWNFVVWMLITWSGSVCKSTTSDLSYGSHEVRLRYVISLLRTAFWQVTLSQSLSIYVIYKLLFWRSVWK